MANQLSSRTSSPSTKRNRVRQALLETLERRELLAADAAAPVFAQGTSQDYVDEMIFKFIQGNSNLGADGSSNFNAGPSRWTNPVGGVSPNAGDPATVTWSIVPDGTQDSNGIATDLVGFMDGIYGDGGTTVVGDKPWFNIFDRAYDRWAEVSGLTFVYEPNDDAMQMGGNARGVAGVRGDIRIGGRNIDGNNGILAFNFFPNNGGNSGSDGDMIIDTNDVFYVANADGPTGENRGLFNVLMHEAGHGIGLGHSIPVDNTKLMEPFINTNFIGPQHDDILGAHVLYGDPAEINDQPGSATDLGAVGNGFIRLTENSLDAENDQDFYRVNVASSGLMSVTLDPVGESYTIGNQGGSTGPVDTLRNQDLTLQILDGSGSVIGAANANGLGGSEEIIDLNLPAGGDYFIQVLGAGSEPQLYDLGITLRGIVDPNAEQSPPRLLSVAPNVGEILSFNNVNEIGEGPTELTFRFDGAQFLDPSSFDGIVITRAGNDNNFGNGNEEVIVPGWIGFGDSDRIIVARFAEALPDDNYQVEIFGAELAGSSLPRPPGVVPVTNLNGEPLRPRAEGTDRDTLFFDLELGALVTGVVPQPTTVNLDGTVSQARNQIEVYFNDDDLHTSAVSTTGAATDPTVVRPEFYNLILTEDTVNPGDDTVFQPTSVDYDPVEDKAVLTFGGDIDQLAGGAGTFRLRVGSNKPIDAAASPLPPAPVVNTLTPGVDPEGFLSGALPLGSFATGVSTVISEQLLNVQNQLFLDFPGSNFEPGHRDIQDQNHLGGFDDDSPFVTQAFYNFALDRPYGLDTFGQPVSTSITPEQMDRVREIYEFYGAQLGIDFVESESAGMTVVVGDPFPNGVVGGPGGVLGVASVDSLNGLAIMDGAENWDNELSYGAGAGQFSFFFVALHEIGHMLGIGHTYELPDGTVLGSTSALAANTGNPLEEIYPGDHDVVHASHGYRPDNKDVDLYSFDVPAGTQGTVSIETIAERLANSSNADTHLTLLRQGTNGLEVVATNNDYFSSDSFISTTLTEGQYFIGVTTFGNEDFDPSTDNTGGGGVSQGAYDLRVSFVPENDSAITDLTGVALDGDGDGIAGGDFNFWFRAAAPEGVASPSNTVFVSKGYGGGGSDGSPAAPFTNLQQATAAVSSGDIIRVVGSLGGDGDISTLGDNPAYEIGRGGVGNAALSDGLTFAVPQGVTAMIDAGAIFKMGGSRVLVGSRDAGSDFSFAGLQVLGTPDQNVFFTSYQDEDTGIDTDPITTQAQAGQWGGLEFHNDVDRAEGRGDWEREGIFLNYVGNADMRFGGGQVTVTLPSPTINPIHLSESRPLILNNTIRLSADAAMSADPNSFEETTFNEPRYQRFGSFFSGYDRVGPDIRQNTLTDNSINGLFVRVDTNAGEVIDKLDVAGRFDDTDVTHVIGENLVIAGTPGGAFLETTAPDVSLVAVADDTGSLNPTDTHSYRVTFVDANGAEGIPSTDTLIATVPASGGIMLSNLPTAPADFVGRRVYRSAPGGGGPFDLIAELDGDTLALLDDGTTLGATLADPAATQLQLARLDGRLAVDPGVVVKLAGSRIEVGIGAQLIAEGTEGQQVVFTSRQDDRFGAGGTFDTNSDGNGTSPAPGDWGGLNARHFSSISIDSSLISFGGGVTSVPGGFAGFNAIEVHQADARIANSTLENNASGRGGNLDATRDGRGWHDSSVIFVRGSQPVIIDNVLRDNNTTGTAAISIDANSMKAVSVQDAGRQTGLSDRLPGEVLNQGPLVTGNRLALNGLNGMRIRGATLTTEAVWDDTDIVHVLESEIVVPDFHTYGGLRLQSKADESLVVKLGSGAGITADGLPLDITDRIGGSLQIIGTPGFPVVMTSFRDDSVGSGFDPTGLPQVDTNSDGLSFGVAGDWRSVRLNPASNDRNLDTIVETESDSIQDEGVNDVALQAQALGGLAEDVGEGDENLRLGFTVHGSIASTADLDVYSFLGRGGTPVWIDIDRTDSSLDSVVELVDIDGNIIAVSDNSLDESIAGDVTFSDPAVLDESLVETFERDPFAKPNTWTGTTATDFQSVNPADAGFRTVLPGAQGEQNTYFVRVRSSNVAPGQSPARLLDPSLEREGLTRGSYRLQVRLQQQDEVAGSTIRYADVRFAGAGIEVIGLPSHSPLLGTTSEPIGPTITQPLNTVNVGNIANSDRAGVSLAGEVESDTDVDWYRFTVNHTQIQSGAPPVSVSFDVDYADGFSRPNTSLWVYRIDEGDPVTTQDDEFDLILIGTDSDIADDQDAPTENLGDVDDLTRGSFGTKDPFIGAQELSPGDYLVAVTNNSQQAKQLLQYQQAQPNAAGAQSENVELFRLEPIDSVQRISVNRFGGGAVETWLPPQQVAFNGGTADNIPFTLADVSTYAAVNLGNATRVQLVNALTGAVEATVGGDIALVNDFALSQDGRLVGYEIPVGDQTDANSGTFIQIDTAGDGTTANIGNSGLNTFTTEAVGGNLQVRQRAAVGDGLQFHGLTFHNPVAQRSTASQRLFGVGQRGDGQLVFNQAILDANNAIIGAVSTAGRPTNFLYRLDPDDGSAINPFGFQNRAGNFRTEGAGTEAVEFGQFVTADPTATVTGLASIGGVLFAVSEDGEFFRAVVGDGNNFVGNIFSSATITDPAVGPVEFSSLAAGPQNLEGGRFANILFGTTATGVTYAFDTTGTLQPVFPGGHFKTQSAAGTAGINGIAFSPLDVNLWHQTDTRAGDAGHGRAETHNSVVGGTAPGGNSLYFGFENSGADGALRQAGDWDPIHSTYDNSYNLPGGAHGAIESQPLDLTNYGADDLPTLYFTYYLETENANNGNLSDNARMRDAFRVYASGDDGQWVLLSTNNSAQLGNNQSGTRTQLDEFDVNLTGNFDANGRPYVTQEAFDVVGGVTPDSWRQVRAPLAAFAGQSNVKLRFEFSTGASFRTGNLNLGGAEFTAVPGSRISDGETFEFTAVDLVDGNSATFEFDLGLVLDLPSGGSIAEGDQIEVDGTVFTFSLTNNGATDILFTPIMTPAEVANAVAAKMVFPTAFNAERGGVLNIDAPAGGAYSVSGLPADTIEALPGVAAGNVPINITQANTAVEVRDAVRAALAAGLNQAGQELNVDVWPVFGETIRAHKYDITNNSGMLLVDFRIGDVFGVEQNFVQNHALTTLDERAQGNDFEGVFIDDIIVGLAERGEAVVSSSPVVTPNGLAGFFSDNQDYEPSGFAIDEIETGRYQLDIRTAADYGGSAGSGIELANPFNPGRSFDSNTRLAPGLSISVDNSAAIADGATLVISNGIREVTFEFDVSTGPTDRALGTTPGNIAIEIMADDTMEDIAIAIRDAINSASAQALIDDVSASVQANSTIVDLHGPVAFSNNGATTFTGIPGLSSIVHGAESFFGEDHGDQNRTRDQGVVLISSSFVRESAGFGITVDAAARNPQSPTTPGAPINYPTDNADGLAPGVVLENNVLDSNALGGILISGDPQQTFIGSGQDVARPSTVARVVNNTVWNTGSGQGILVNQGASPIILNNILANTSVGIDVAGAQNTFVLGANFYFGNGANTNPGGAPESFRIVSGANPFVDPTAGNFYLVDGTPAIDSSLNALPELASITQIRSSLGLPPSPTLAPEHDIFGLQRVDDPVVNSPTGLGSNVFKDRGAIDRADFVGLEAVLLRPLDNDSENIDIDRTDTKVRLAEGNLDFFEILLSDPLGGTGPDSGTVTPEAVFVTENSRTLRAGVDYVFGYNANNRTIRLTPLSGIWRTDSVYEITMNNVDGIRIAAPDGAAISDGDTFEVVIGGVTNIFEWDDDGAAVETPVSFSQSFTRYEMAARIVAAIRGLGVEAYLQGDDSLMVTGVDSINNLVSTNVGAITDVAGNNLFANRANTLTQFTILMPDVQVDYGDAQVADTLQVDNGSRHAILPIDAPSLALGIFADGDLDGAPSDNAKADDNDATSLTSTIPGITSSPQGTAVLIMPAPGLIDGEVITLTDDEFKTVPFEFDSDGSNSGTGVIVDISASVTADDVADAFRDAVNNAVLAGLITDLAAFSNGNEVDLGGTDDTVVDLSASSATRKLTGNFSLVFPAAGYTDGQTITVVDGNGVTTIFEINDLASANTFTTVGNIPVDIDLTLATPADIVQAIADTMNDRIIRGQLALGRVGVNGLELTFLSDDEDGVAFGGVFNEKSAPVPVTVTSTGPGILDVWFDWNGDGDFRDPGEQLFSNLPIEAGDTVLDIQTPVGAATGFIASRFRVSRLGNLHLDCIGIGGEVEDHLVEVVAGDPPIANDDVYEVLEDDVLIVSAADGVLLNDTDADSAVIRVKDEDILSPGIQPVQDVTRGTLILNEDGSFQYTPDFDFFGEDTFVYNTIDTRLTSNVPATVTIQVREVNDAPTAIDDQISIFEDEILAVPGSTFTANDFKGIFGNPSQTNELGQNLEVVSAVIMHPDPGLFGGSFTVVNDQITFVPPAHYNNEIDGPIQIELTIQDDGVTWVLGSGPQADPLTATSILTIDVTPLNDSPEYDVVLNPIGVEEDQGPVSFQVLDNIGPGPTEATDEATGPALNFEDQQVSFTATALQPTLFATLPTISPAGILDFELAPGVTNNPPFPPEILVEVLATDTGADEGVIRNLFDAATHPVDSYDGATLTINDGNGNTVVFEFDDVNAAGVGMSAGVPHAPVIYDPAVDTPATFMATLLATINNPPTASISGGGVWGVEAFEDAVTGEIRLVGEDSFTSSLGAATLHPLDGRPAHDAVVQTLTITVAAINDAPVFEMPVNPIALLEDAGPQTITDFVINAAAGPPESQDENASQTLTLSVVAADPTAFAVQPTAILDADGTADLMFELAPDINNDTLKDLSIIVTLMDDGGVNHPQDVDTTVQTLGLDVTPVNDAPSFTLSQTEVTVFEDHEDVTGNDPTTFVAFALNPVAGPGTAVDETILPLTRQGLIFTLTVSDPSLFEQQPVITDTGDLIFTTADDQNGSAEIVVRLMDTGDDPSTGRGDENTAVPDQTFTINITAVNDPPVFTLPTEHNSIEDQGLVQVLNFATDLAPGPGTATDEVGQTFVVDVVALDPSAFAVQPAIAADGTLTYQLAADVNSLNADLRVEATLTDDGTPGPLPDNNTSPTQTFLIVADPINDAPTFDLLKSEITVIEDSEDFFGSSPTIETGVAANMAPGPITATDEIGQGLNFDIVSVSAPELFETQPAISPTGDLTFVTADNRNGTAFVVLRLTDDGDAAPPPNDNDSQLQTITINITPINDAPEFTVPATITVDEDEGLVSQNGFATDVRRGPDGTNDENSQQINFTVVATDPSAFATQPAIAPDGTLTFETAQDVNSNNANLEVKVTLSDNGLDTPVPNENTSVEKTFVIVVNPVNDAPIPNAFVADATEDGSITINAADVLIGDLPGPSDEANQSLVMTQIERTSANLATITPVFNGDEIVSFTYTPPKDLVGTDTFQYVVTDDGNPAQSGSGTITINIAGINDAPQFTKGPDQTVPEDADTVSIADWATGISAGPASAADENATQTVTFDVTADDPTLFEVQPSVASDGTLSFKPAADANGTAIITLFAMDDGDGVAPNVNQSAPQSFAINITPVNDAPAFTAGANVTVVEDSGAYAQPWASGIAAAAGLLGNPQTATDEGSQVVSFTTTTDSPELFQAQPFVTPTGELQFTPANDAFGTAVVSVVAVDSGPSGGLDTNQSAPQEVTVVITPVNDAPVAVGDTYSTDENSLLAEASPGILANDTDVDLPSDSLTVIPVTTTSSLGAVVVVSADGGFTYDPTSVQAIQQLTTGQSVLDTFTYQVEDSNGVASLPGTVTVNVTGVDDAPIAVDDTYSLGVGQSRLLDVLTNDTDIDSAIDPRTITITSIPVSGTAQANQTGVIEYTSEAGFRGIVTFDYTVRDGAGNVSNEATVTLTINNAPVASNDFTFTYKNEPIDINVLANDSDVDGTIDPSTVEVVVGPNPSGSGVEVLADGQIRFTPATDFAGEVQFSYVVRDDVGTVSNVADVLVRIQNSLWQNPQGNLDVNDDGFVTPIDALIVINYLNSGQETFLPNTDIVPEPGVGPYLDPTGDETVSALDALVIINFLNNLAANGEGEASYSSEEFAMMVTPQQVLETVGPEIVRQVRESMDQTLIETLSESEPAKAVEIGPRDTNLTYGPLFPGDVAEEREEDLINDLLDDGQDHSAIDDFFGSV